MLSTLRLDDLRRSMEGLDRICAYFKGVHGIHASTPLGVGILFNGRLEHEKWSAFYEPGRALVR